MLPAKKRLSVPLFTTALTQGKIVHSPLFTARIWKTTGDSRFSAVVSKKIAKTAVLRNKFRRRIYSVLGRNMESVKAGFHIILLAKPTIIKTELKDIASDLENLFVKSSLLK